MGKKMKKTAEIIVSIIFYCKNLLSKNIHEMIATGIDFIMAAIGIFLLLKINESDIIIEFKILLAIVVCLIVGLTIIINLIVYLND